MNIFGKRKKDNGDAGSGKLKDFLRNQEIDDAEILSEENSGNNSNNTAAIDFKSVLGKNGLLVICLVAGVIAGFVYGHFFGASGGIRFNSYDAASLTRNVQLGKAEKVKYTSAILYNDVDVYNMPSDVSGSVIAKLGRGMKVENLGLVPSLDTKENVGITRFDIKISRLFSKSFIIPEGTEVNLLGFNNSTKEYDANVSLNGKIHNITVNSNEVKIPYTRGWIKVRLENGQEGYIYGDSVAVRALK